MGKNKNNEFIFIVFFYIFNESGIKTFLSKLFVEMISPVVYIGLRAQSKDV